MSDSDSNPWMGHLAGRLLVFDGPDGSGKSTQITRFVRAAREEGVDLIEIREPGGTPIGEHIREILLDTRNAEMSLRCEMMLYMASRAQLAEQEITPALKNRKLVIADRFISSTLAYQGTAGGLPVDDILAVGKVALGDLWPDLTVIFDVDEPTAASRLSPQLDRIEARGAEFHRRVRQGFLDQANSHPDQYLVIDATNQADEVQTELMSGLKSWVMRNGT